MWSTNRFTTTRTVCIFLCSTFLMTVSGNAWQARSSNPTVLIPQTGSTTRGLPDLTKGEENDSTRIRMEENAAKARNTDRFKRLQSDTDKLLKLSTELKEDVDKSTKNELSLDVIRKAAEVEKLAHDIKERMRG